MKTKKRHKINEKSRHRTRKRNTTPQQDKGSSKTNRATEQNETSSKIKVNQLQLLVC